MLNMEHMYTRLLLDDDLTRTQTGFEKPTEGCKEKIPIGKNAICFCDIQSSRVHLHPGSAPFKHYRRSKTNKAPRKRSFVANMTKSPTALSETLESAASGM